MLILVGVTVSIAINGGLFGTAKDAVRQTQIAEIREQVQTDIAVQGATNLGDITSKQLKSILDNYFTDVPETLPEDLSEVTLTAKEEYGGYKDIPLTDIYNGILGEESKPTEILVANDIAENPTKYYGEEVAGYNVGIENNLWRIYYADENNIYLILDDVINQDEAPLSTKGNSLNKSTYYENGLYFDNILDDYEGSAWIIENSQAKEWLSMYLNECPNDTDDTAKAVAYMMDTNAWSKFVDPNFAEYAIGSPTIELFINSYKGTHNEYSPEIRVGDYEGYQYKDTYWSNWFFAIWRMEYDALDSSYSSIYASKNQGSDYWIASPGGGVLAVMETQLGESKWDDWNDGPRDSFLSFRPVVKLSSQVQLERINGTLRVTKVEN